MIVMQRNYQSNSQTTIKTQDQMLQTLVNFTLSIKDRRWPWITSFYTAMGGAKHALENQAIVSNNIANVSTSGFKGTAVRHAGSTGKQRYRADPDTGGLLDPERI